MAATMPPDQNADAQGNPPPQNSSDNNSPTSAKDAIGKSLGGMFGGFGKKKKQDQQADSAASANGATAATSVPPPPAPVKGSMMDMAIQITSYSNGSLDSDLFDIPVGYTQVQQDSSGK
jgi:hypothetical protein